MLLIPASVSRGRMEMREQMEIRFCRRHDKWLEKQRGAEEDSISKEEDAP